MGIFTSIRNAIFGKDEPEGAARTPATTTATAPAQPAPEPEVLDVVDVEERLDAMPGAAELNWRTSIVDLMKLIDVDSDYESREELAEELGIDHYSGSAEENILLHRLVMKELAQNGGKVPAEFLD